MRIVASLLVGLIFGLGLVISGMTNPAKVQNFLDILGTWDPSLIFVMGGAILIAMPGFFLAKKMDKPLLATEFKLPTKMDIDEKLLIGSGLFGMGWGLGGFCPGPAITALSTGVLGVAAFTIAMMFGMMVAKDML